jgi:hypothetical protein
LTAPHAGVWRRGSHTITSVSDTLARTSLACLIRHEQLDRSMNQSGGWSQNLEFA